MGHLLEASVQQRPDPMVPKPPASSIVITRQFAFTGQDGMGGLEAAVIDLESEPTADVLDLVAYLDRHPCAVETPWDDGDVARWLGAVEATQEPNGRPTARHTSAAAAMKG